MKSKNSDDDYVKMLVLVFIAFGAFVVAIVAGYFGTVGLYFGQGIVEVDVFDNKYKYFCDTINGSPDVDAAGVCNSFNTSSELPSWTDYQETRTIINSLVPKFLVSTFVIFSLLGLVFLFLALRSAGLFGGKGKEKVKDEWS